MNSHEIDYRILGDDLQCVEVELDPQETVIAEAGGMLYMEEGISFETKMGDGSKPDGCLVAFESTVEYDIERAGNLKSMLFGGEGIFLATLKGTGRVWLQSLPFSRLADRILKNAPKAGGKSSGEGSVLKRAVDLFQ